MCGGVNIDIKSPLIGKTIKCVEKSNYCDKNKPIAEIEYCNIYFTDGSSNIYE